MAEEGDASDSPEAIAEMVLQIGRLAESLGYARGLKPSQWAALRYFAQAAPEQCTVSAFAGLQATTRGAASQTVEVLVNKGLLTRATVPGDRRVVRVQPTEAALVHLEHDPFRSFVAVIDRLPAESRRRLAELLASVLHGLLAKRRTA